MARTPIYIEVKDSAGNVVPSASVNIKRRSNGADATLYNAEVAGSVIANPSIADSMGRVSVWVDRGDYNAVVSGGGISTYTVPIDAFPGGDADIDVPALPLPLQGAATLVTVQTGGPMPSSPANGDEVIYTADATNGITWRFKYRAASASTYKWEYLGGPSLIAEVATTAVEATSSTTYAALTTAGPSITVPLAGDYEIGLKFMAYSASDGGYILMSYDVGATTATDADACAANIGTGGGIEVYPAAKRKRKTIPTAGVAVTAKYRTTSGANAANFVGTTGYPGASRFMEIRPIRVA